MPKYAFSHFDEKGRLVEEIKEAENLSSAIDMALEDPKVIIIRHFGGSSGSVFWGEMVSPKESLFIWSSYIGTRGVVLLPPNIAPENKRVCALNRGDRVMMCKKGDDGEIKKTKELICGPSIEPLNRRLLTISGGKSYKRAPG